MRLRPGTAEYGSGRLPFSQAAAGHHHHHACDICTIRRCCHFQALRTALSAASAASAAHVEKYLVALVGLALGHAGLLSGGLGSGLGHLLLGYSWLLLSDGLSWLGGLSGPDSVSLGLGGTCSSIANPSRQADGADEADWAHGGTWGQMGAEQWGRWGRGVRGAASESLAVNRVCQSWPDSSREPPAHPSESLLGVTLEGCKVPLRHCSRALCCTCTANVEAAAATSS